MKITKRQLLEAIQSVIDEALAQQTVQTQQGQLDPQTAGVAMRAQQNPAQRQQQAAKNDQFVKWFMTLPQQQKDAVMASLYKRK